MADLISFGGIGVAEATFLGDATLAFDPVASGGHAKAGWAALTLVGNDTLKLAGDGDRIVAVLSHVEKDGKVVASFKGFQKVRKGDQAVTVNTVLVGDARATGITGDGYVRSETPVLGTSAQATGNVCTNTALADAVTMLLK